MCKPHQLPRSPALHRFRHARRHTKDAGRDGEGRCRQLAARSEAACAVQCVGFLALPPAAREARVACDRVDAHRSAFYGSGAGCCRCRSRCSGGRLDQRYIH
jgi:hypothetical protein